VVMTKPTYLVTVACRSDGDIDQHTRVFTPDQRVELDVYCTWWLDQDNLLSLNILPVSNVDTHDYPLRNVRHAATCQVPNL
jgi:hypothetical protein